VRIQLLHIADVEVAGAEADAKLAGWSLLASQQVERVSVEEVNLGAVEVLERIQTVPEEYERLT